MRFYWSYHPRYWEGLRSHGLLEGDVGVRFVHSPWAREDELANVQLALGTELASLILEGGLGLLIDRGCGGIEYRPYGFDGELLAYYAGRLGDRFLGIQMHEWYGNMVNDLGRIRDAGGAAALGQQIRDLPQDLLNHHLEYGEVADYLDRRFPQTVAEFQSEADHHYQRKAADFFGYVALTDSYYQSYWWGFQNGARHAMAEIGGQTALTRLQIASVRGAARAYGRGWGVYYEQWACPLSVLWYNREQSFWKVPDSLRGESYFIHGGRGGSSRALQRRMLYYALLAGAGSLVEEWGGENTFHDWDSFPLTDYGRIMREFFLFAHQVGVGEPVTKVAIMLDVEDGPLDHDFLDGRYETVVRYYPPTDRQRTIRDRLREIYETPEDEVRYGEPHTLTSARLPDVFDVVYSDISTEALRRYEVVYYLGGRFAAARDRLKAYPGLWLDGLPGGVATLESYLRQELPLWVSGPVAWTINKIPEGWLIGLFNNAGVVRTVEVEEHYDPEQDCQVILTLKRGARVRDLLEDSREILSPCDGQYEVAVSAGGCRLLECREGI